MNRRRGPMRWERWRRRRDHLVRSVVGFLQLVNAPEASQDKAGADAETGYAKDELARGGHGGLCATLRAATRTRSSLCAMHALALSQLVDCSPLPNLNRREPPRRANACADTTFSGECTHARKPHRAGMLSPYACRTPDTVDTATRPRGYARAGHAKKLEPIIASLDYYDHDPAAWRSLKTSVKQMNDGWDTILRQVPCGTDEYAILVAQRDCCVEALRVQIAMFNDHRKTCRNALKLQRV